MIANSEELEANMFMLVDMFVSDSFKLSDQLLYKSYKDLAGQKLHPVHDKAGCDIRKRFVSELKNRVDYFKLSLRDALFSKEHEMELNVLSVEVENETADHLTGSSAELPTLPMATPPVIESTQSVSSIASRRPSRHSSRFGEKKSEPQRDKVAIMAAVIDTLSNPVRPVGRRAMTNIKPTPAKLPVEVATKQELKRKRKKYIKKLLKSILDFRRLRQVKHTHYYAYVNDKLAYFESGAVAKFFEEEGGFVALSMVKDLRRITPEEQEVSEHVIYFSLSTNLSDLGN